VKVDIPNGNFNPAIVRTPIQAVLQTASPADGHWTLACPYHCRQERRRLAEHVMREQHTELFQEMKDLERDLAAVNKRLQVH
jgi:hypothetical protein